ncbi:MAG: hypothetical protein A2X86_12435 [Bdellovibrionales bacterium GWA2_49_15]|nr:MAG: hypothetical protein A2X86_12435 [Bdellovibrionales bacterium GWA2_49_15]
MGFFKMDCTASRPKISLSVKRSGSKYNLRVKAWEHAYELVAQLSANFKRGKTYQKLEELIGVRFADILIKKELFIALVPFCREYERRIELKQSCDQSWQVPIEVQDPILGFLLRERFATSGILIKLPSFSTRIIQNFKNIFFMFIDFCLSNLSVVLMKQSRVTAKIGIELNEGVPNGSKRSEFNWYKHSNLALEKYCLFFLNGETSTVKNEKEKMVLNNFLSAGISIVSDDQQICKMAKISRVYVPKKLRRFLPIFSTKQDLWLKTKYGGQAMLFNFWKNVFRKQGIKVLMISNEGDIDVVMQSAAIASLNGISICRQRSLYPNYSCIGYHPAHLGLSWNEDTIRYWQEAKNQNEYCIPIGHSFLDKNEYAENDSISHKIREEFARYGVDFVVAFFDTNTGPDLDFTTERMFTLVTNLAKFVLATPKMGLIIKGKHRNDLKSILDDEIQKALERQGRLQFYTKNILPNIISKSADLTIGSGLSSAAWEANCREFRAIHFHPTCIENHFIYEKGHNRLIFDNFDTMINAIKDLMAYPESSLLGLAGDLLPRFDYFHDGLAPKRMAKIMQKALESDLTNRSDFYAWLKKEFEANTLA